jgi:hypothetical protein
MFDFLEPNLPSEATITIRGRFAGVDLAAVRLMEGNKLNASNDADKWLVSKLEYKD